MLLFANTKKKYPLLSKSAYLVTSTNGVPICTKSTNMLSLQKSIPWIYNSTNKIKFRRKGSWIRTFKLHLNPIKLKFGFGHPMWILKYDNPRLRYKRYLSQHCIMWVTSYYTNNYVTTKLTELRPFNCYTMTGIRQSRFFLLKRKGKETKYSSLKSKIF